MRNPIWWRAAAAADAQHDVRRHHRGRADKRPLAYAERDRAAHGDDDAGHIEKIEAAKRAGERMAGGLYRRTRPTKDGGKVSRWEVRFDGLAGCLRVPTGGSCRQTVMIVEGDFGAVAALVAARGGAADGVA